MDLTDWQVRVFGALKHEALEGAKEAKEAADAAKGKGKKGRREVKPTRIDRRSALAIAKEKKVPKHGRSR